MCGNRLVTLPPERCARIIGAGPIAAVVDANIRLAGPLLACVAVMDRFELADPPGESRGPHVPDIGKRPTHLAGLVLNRQFWPPEDNRGPRRRDAFLNKIAKQLDLFGSPATS